MKTENIYEEELTSNITEALFAVLMLLFLGLFTWRVLVVGWRFLPFFFLFMGVFFLFYVLNYRRLIVRIDEQAIRLRFGIFHWTIPLENIERCELDEVLFSRLGGAGIHFTMVDKRYRANLNFLDRPRVLVCLKKKQGPVRDISFSTCQPETVMAVLNQKIH